MKDVTVPVPRTPAEQIDVRTVAVHARNTVAITVLGGFFLLVVLLFTDAMLGILFTYVPLLIVLAFFGWPLARLMHVIGRWVLANIRRV